MNKIINIFGLFLLVGIFCFGFVSANGYCSNADINRDGVVDDSDYNIWYDNNGKVCEVGSWCDYADINRDKQVTGADFSVWKAKKGSTGCVALCDVEWADVNQDGIVTETDKNLVNDAWVSNTYPGGCFMQNNYCDYMDVNRDGAVNVADRAMVQAWTFAFIDYDCSRVDINNDGRVTPSDYSPVNNNIGMSGCSESNNWCDKTDISHNAQVDTVDIEIIRQNMNCVYETQTCTDSDKGIDYSVQGHLIDETHNADYLDSCLDEEELREYYCGEENYLYLDYICPNGCEDGACIVGENICDNADIDGNGGVEPTDLSIIINALNGLSVPYSDSILDVNDDGVVDDGDKDFITDCLNGIEPSINVCYDSDGGLNYYIFGETTNRFGTFQDGCSSNGYACNDLEMNQGRCIENGLWNGSNLKFVDENYCDGSNVWYVSYECPNGCVNGACVIGDVEENQTSAFELALIDFYKVANEGNGKIGVWDDQSEEAIDDWNNDLFNEDSGFPYIADGKAGIFEYGNYDYFMTVFKFSRLFEEGEREEIATLLMDNFVKKNPICIKIIFKGDVLVLVGGPGKEKVPNEFLDEMSNEFFESSMVGYDNLFLGCGSSSNEIEDCSSGCVLDNKCYPFGYRRSGEFCSDNGIFLSQLSADETCDNSFECDSNVCVSGKCVEAGLIQKIINWFKKIFG